MAPCGKQGISDPDQAVQGWVDAKSAVQHVMTADNPKRYWAFISHSHQDAAWARWLLRSLETYRLPKAIVGQQTAMGPAPRHLKPVFRDRDELAADPDLTGRLERVIEQSHAMIVICSPSAARSEWANEEIKAFRSQNGDQNLFCLIVDGEPNAQLSKKPGLEECFPSALREDANGKTLTSIRQPIAADLRPGGDGKRLALLKIVAGLLGVGLDDLVKRDSRRRQHQLTAIAAGSVAGMVAMGGLAAVAVSERIEAERQRAQAEGLIEFMLVDLRKSLEPAGKLDALSSVGKRAMDYYAAQRADRQDADSLGRRSRVLHLLGDVDDQKGDLNSAIGEFREAAVSTEALLKREPNSPQRIFDHAQSVYWIGYAAWRHGQAEEAERRFREYAALANRLIQLKPDNTAWMAEVGYANNNLGMVQLERGSIDAARASFERSLSIKSDLVRLAPTDRDLRTDLAQTWAWMADVEAEGGHYKAAIDLRQKERATYQALLADRPTDLLLQTYMVVNRRTVAQIFHEQGREAEAIGESRAASKAAAILVASDARNALYRQQLAASLVSEGEVCLEAGNRVWAEQVARQALSEAERLRQIDPSVVAWSGTLLGGARVLQIRLNLSAAKTANERRRALETAPAEFGRLVTLLNQSSQSSGLRPVTAMVGMLAGDYAALVGMPEVARRDWQTAAGILDGRKSAGSVQAIRDALKLRISHSAVPKNQ